MKFRYNRLLCLVILVGLVASLVIIFQVLGGTFKFGF